MELWEWIVYPLMILGVLLTLYFYYLIGKAAGIVIVRLLDAIEYRAYRDDRDDDRDD